MLEDHACRSLVAYHQTCAIQRNIDGGGQFLYATQGGADRAPHTRRGLWASPGKFFSFLFLFFFSVFLPFTFFYDSKNVENSKMLNFEKCSDSKVCRFEK
jgi:hypothetical protein